MKRGTSYIGVTGFTHIAQVERALEIADEHFPSNRKLMVGVLISGKSLNGIPTKYPRQYLPVATLPVLFTSHPRAYNIVHFNTDSTDILSEFMRIEGAMDDVPMHGIQLNLSFPENHVIALQKRHYQHPSYDFILQTNDLGASLKKEDIEVPDDFAKWLGLWSGVCSHTLFDLSCGRGVSFDPKSVLPYLRATHAVLPSVSHGVAGGLKPGNLEEKLSVLLSEFPTLSWDTQAGVRNEHDSLDMSKVEDFLIESGELAKKYNANN